MEQELREHLLALVRAYMAETGLPISTVSTLAGRDVGYFQRLERNAPAFTVRKYDEIVRWFSLRWPENTPWPEPKWRRGQCA